jgi:hypothetical protein
MPNPTAAQVAEAHEALAYLDDAAIVGLAADTFMTVQGEWFEVWGQAGIPAVRAIARARRLEVSVDAEFARRSTQS